MPLKIHAHNPMVVVLESHLEIETGELGQVPVGVGVLGPEYGADFVLPLHICDNGHLLGQLGRLPKRWAGGGSRSWRRRNRIRWQRVEVSEIVSW